MGDQQEAQTVPGAVGGELHQAVPRQGRVEQRCSDLTKRCGELERKGGQVKTLEQQVMGLNNANVQMKNELHQARTETMAFKQHNDTLARECANYKNQVEQNNKYMRDYG